MATVQSQVLDAVVAALNKTGVAKAYRTRFTRFGVSQLPAWNVLPEEGEAHYFSTDETTRRFRFAVRALGAATDEADRIVDALYLASVQALMQDPTLGGLVRYTREISQKWTMDKPGESDAIACEALFDVEFATGRSDPSLSVA